MSPIVYAIPVFMASILAEAWVARRRRPGAYAIPDALTSLHFGVLSQVWGAFTIVAFASVYALAHGHLRLLTLPADHPGTWVFALLLYDFCYYWAHRAGHEVNLLWASHQVHHSSEYYNLTTALRQTSTSHVLNWPFYLPLALAGVPPVVFGAVALVDLLYQYWVHTELVGRLGWADRFLVTPSNHRVHHGQNDYCIDRNYGGILVLWDRLFGTFAEERTGEPIAYGVRKPLASCNPVWGNFNVFVDLLRRSRAAPTPAAALRTWFDAPAGRGQPLPHLDVTMLRRYDPGTSLSARRYALVQYVLLVPLVLHFLMIVRDLGGPAALSYAAIVTAGVLGIGWALEERAFARRFEFSRVAALALAVVLLPDWFGWVLPQWAAAGYALSALASLALLRRQSPRPAAEAG